MHIIFIGIHLGAVEKWKAKRALEMKALQLPVAPLPPLKQHKFKYGFPKLESYAAHEVPSSF